MKCFYALLLAFCLLLGGCAPQAQEQQKPYTATFFTLFDTVTTIIGRGDNEAAFQERAQAIYQDLWYYHQLFDIYHDYAGVNNIKTINDNAGIRPVQVDPAMIQFLQDCKEYYHLTDGKVNVAMGSVLQLWHDARNDGMNDPPNAKLPDLQKLEAAAQHTDINCIVIDTEKSTVYISDAHVRLDVGAVAKGWATQRAAENAPSGMLISVGGNVCATGPKLPDGTPWVIGIQDPDQADKNLHTLSLTGGSVVTSGDYQRRYLVDGKFYHHIIDPATQMPGEYWRSVSVICPDSGLADALSTALFLMDRQTGEALALQCGAEVLWVDAEGSEFMTTGFESQLRD